MGDEHLAFQIDRRDNVATALTPLIPGMVALIGDALTDALLATEAIAQGHKLALCDIAEGEDIVKYGVRIGRAERAIGQGEWVHLHNMHSAYDERSSHLDAVTGAPTDMRYE